MAVSMTRILSHSKEGLEMAVLGETSQDFTMAEIAAYSGWGTFWSRLMGAVKQQRVGTCIGRVEHQY